jgi:hypothetical protein
MSPRRGSTPRLTDRLTVGRNATLTLTLLNSDQRNLWRVKLQAGQQLRVSKFPPEQRRAFPLVPYIEKRLNATV